jgi:fatty acid desaturase
VRLTLGSIKRQNSQQICRAHHVQTNIAEVPHTGASDRRRRAGVGVVAEWSQAIGDADHRSGRLGRARPYFAFQSFLEEMFDIPLAIWVIAAMIVVIGIVLFFSTAVGIFWIVALVAAAIFFFLY